MKLDALFEGISPVVFHSTHLSALRGIISRDVFELSTDLAKESEKMLGDDKTYYFLSTSRVKSNGFRGSLPTTLVLDGVKLSQNLKGRPVDYFRDSVMDSGEQEDRIFSTTPQIKNAKKFIKEVHIMYTPDLTKGNELRSVMLMLKKNKIRTFVHQNPQSYQALDKRKSLKVKDIDFKNPNFQSEFTRIIEMNPLQEEALKVIIELYGAKEIRHLSNNALKELPYLSSPQQGMSRTTTNALRDFNVLRYDNPTRVLVNKVIAILKKERLASFKDLYSLLDVKWVQIRRHTYELPERPNKGW